MTTPSEPKGSFSETRCKHERISEGISLGNGFDFKVAVCCSCCHILVWTNGIEWVSERDKGFDKGFKAGQDSIIRWCDKHNKTIMFCEYCLHDAENKGRQLEREDEKEITRLNHSKGIREVI